MAGSSTLLPVSSHSKRWSCFCLQPGVIELRKAEKDREGRPATQARIVHMPVFVTGSLAGSGSCLPPYTPCPPIPTHCCVPAPTQSFVPCSRLAQIRASSTPAPILVPIWPTPSLCPALSSVAFSLKNPFLRNCLIFRFY